MLTSARRARRNRAQTFGVICGIAIGMTFGLIACTAEPDAQIELPARNIDAWVLPLDEFKWVDVSRSTYAELVLIQPCMNDAGLPFDFPPYEERERSESFNDAMYRLNTEELSAKWGYHIAPVAPSRYAAEWQQLDDQLTALSPTDYAIFEGCREAAREELPIVSDIHNFTAALEFDAADVALEEDAVVEAIAAWAECMAPQGIADLPENPVEMPSPSQGAALGLEDPQSPVSAAEREAAVADSRCRSASGFYDAYYDALWNAEAAAFEENSDTLFRNRELLNQHTEEVTAIIAAYSGSN